MLLFGIVIFVFLQIILNSMHKYLPCMKITCLKDSYSQSFSFPETTFIAVTAYQSSSVSPLSTLW